MHLSICIPAYKAERYLAETLASVRAQTYSNWEVVLVEDGSHDRAEEIFADFAAGGAQRTVFHRHAQNQGLPATRNTGIGLASSAWIVLLDSDDLWEPSHLADLVDCARANPAAELVHAGSVLFDSDTGRELGLRVPSAPDLAEFPRSLFLGRYIIQPASVMLSRTLWDRAGRFDPSFRYVEDRDMWLRCARAGGRFAYTGRTTCRYRKHGTALSTHSAAMAEASARVFDKHLDWEAIPLDLRRRLAAEAWEAAGKLRQRADPRLAARHFERACHIRWRPSWALRTWVLRALSLAHKRA